MGRTRSSSRFPPGTDNRRPGQSISQPCKQHLLPSVLPTSAPPSAGHQTRPLPAGPSPSGSLPGWLPHFAGLPLPEQSWRPVHAPSSSHVLSCFIHSTNCLGVATEHSRPPRRSALVTETPASSLRLGPGDMWGRLHSPRTRRGNRPHVGSRGALWEAHTACVVSGGDSHGRW